MKPRHRPVSHVGRDDFVHLLEGTAFASQKRKLRSQNPDAQRFMSSYTGLLLRSVMYITMIGVYSE